MLKVSEVAKRLSLSESKIYQMVATGELPHHRMGGAIRFSEEDLADYLEATKRERGIPAKKPPRPRLKHLKL